MGITSRGTVRVKQVQVPARGAPVRVTRVVIPRLPGHGRINSTAKRGDGVLIGGVWVVFTDWTKDRLHFTVDAAKEILVSSPVPVSLDS